MDVLQEVEAADNDGTKRAKSALNGTMTRDLVGPALSDLHSLVQANFCIKEHHDDEGMLQYREVLLKAADLFSYH